MYFSKLADQGWQWFLTQNDKLFVKRNCPGSGNLKSHLILDFGVPTQANGSVDGSLYQQYFGSHQFSDVAHILLNWWTLRIVGETD